MTSSLLKEKSTPFSRDIAVKLSPSISSHTFSLLRITTFFSILPQRAIYTPFSMNKRYRLQKQQLCSESFGHFVVKVRLSNPSAIVGVIFSIRQPSGRCRQGMPDRSAFSHNASLKLLPILCPVSVHFRYRTLSIVSSEIASVPSVQIS